MPQLLMISSLNTSSFYFTASSKESPLSISSPSAVVGGAASSNEQWTLRNGCRPMRTGIVVVAHLNSDAAHETVVAADGTSSSAVTSSERGGDEGWRSDLGFTRRARQQNEFQDGRNGPECGPAGRPRGENPLFNIRAKEEKRTEEENGGADGPLRRWLSKTRKDVWKAPKKRGNGAQEGRKFGSSSSSSSSSRDVPGLWKTYSGSSIEHLENINFPDSEGMPSSWPERNDAMLAVQTADDVQTALLRVGGKLEVSDLNAVLRRFGRLGKWKESYALFHWMKEQGKLSPPTYTSFFSVLGKARQVEKVLQEFAELKDKDTLSNLYVWNSLLSTLIGNGKVVKAFQYFQQLKEQGLEPDRVTYSTMISGCSKALGGYYKAQELVKEMQAKGFKLNSVMYGALINVCASNHMLEEARARFDEMIAEGFVPNLFHFSSLLNAYALKGQHHEAENIIMEIKTAGLKPNKVVYNSLINAYARAKLPLQAKEKFEEMMDHGLLPDMISYCSLMDAYGRVGQPEKARAVFDRMKAAGLKPGSNSYSLLIAAYGRSGNRTMIKKVSREVIAKVGSADADVHLFNALLKVCCQAFDKDGVMDILRKMEAEACSPNRITFHVLMAYFCKEGLYDLSISAMHDMEAKGYPANEFSGDVRMGQLLIGSDGLLCRLVKQTSYTILIQGFLSGGKLDETLDFLRQMQQRGITPTRITFQDMMSTFIPLRMVDKVQEVFESMKTSRHVVLRTLLEDYLQLLAEEGRLDLVTDVLEVMKSIDHSPGQELWDLLLLKADAQMDYRILKKVLEQPGCSPNQNTIDILFERAGGLKRPDILQRLEAVHYRPHVS